MNSKQIRRGVRRLGHSLGLWTDWEQKLAAINAIKGEEKGAEWYDNAFARSEGYHVHYTQSCYYFSWSVIADRIARYEAKSILEIGCGPGQFALMLHEQGLRSYAGLDFSPTAIAMARQNVPSFQFIVDDARTSDIYSQFNYDAIVCTEVLEHVQDDLVIVSRFGTGKRCLCTVPNFPYESHVRHFANTADVHDRYARFFDSLTVTRLKGTRGPTEVFFLMDGVRNDGGA